MNKGENSPNYKKAYKVTINLIKDTKRIYPQYLGGIFKTLLNYDCVLDQDAIEGMKMAIMDNYYGGIEPDYHTLDAAKWWDNMTPEYISDELKIPPKLFN